MCLDVCLVVVGCGQLGGYVATFDLRDPGEYTLQVVISAFFGDTEPQHEPVPIVVGTHAMEYTECNTLRSLVSGVYTCGYACACLHVCMCARVYIFTYGVGVCVFAHLSFVRV